MTRILPLLLALFAIILMPTAPAHAADDISAASRSVVRVVTVAMVEGDVVGFGHGSGIAISPTRIVTNAHVVESAVKYPDNVALGVVPSEGQKSYAGKLIAIDTARDLALIEISGTRLPVAAIYTGPIEPVRRHRRARLSRAISRWPWRPRIRPAMVISPDAPSAAVQRVRYRSGSDDVAGGRRREPRQFRRPDLQPQRPGRRYQHRDLLAVGRQCRHRLRHCRHRVAKGVVADLMKVRPASTAAGSAMQIRDRAALDAESRASAEADAAKNAAAQLDRDLKQARAEEDALASRENRIALAGVLFVIGALAAGAGLLFYSQKNMRNAKIAGGAGAVLMLGAAILFATRPDARAEIAAETAPVAADAPKLAAGNFLCTIRPDRSRITVSATTDVPMTIRAGGCVNDRTQYAQGSDGRWQRILVPNEEATVTVASIDSTGREYRVDRYLLDAETMTKAREIRAGVTLKSCTADASELAGLAAQQDAIRSALPASPNERLVYRCQPAAAGAAVRSCGRA